MKTDYYEKWPQLYATLELLPTANLKRARKWIKDNPGELITGSQMYNGAGGM